MKALKSQQGKGNQTHHRPFGGTAIVTGDNWEQVTVGNERQFVKSDSS